ncbi:MAG: hypothetical protein ACK5XK_09055 [Phycisphaerales bacterium]|jgi:hypothetical protein
MNRASSDRLLTSLRELSLNHASVLSARSVSRGRPLRQPLRQPLRRALALACALVALGAIAGCGSVRGTGKPLIQDDGARKASIEKDSASTQASESSAVPSKTAPKQ